MPPSDDAETLRYTAGSMAWDREEDESVAAFRARMMTGLPVDLRGTVWASF